MKVLSMMMFMCVIGVNGDMDDHNKDAHRRLCDVLRASVYKWEDVKKRDDDDPLRKALGRTLFGNDGRMDLESIRTFSAVYRGDEDRDLFCGQRHAGYNKEKQLRWPGYSGPHDLLCLCTPGENGWPLKSSNDDRAKNKLCGQEKGTSASENEGWSKNKENKKGEKQMKATWDGVVQECLKDDGHKRNLQDALKVFTEKLEHKSGDVTNPDRYQLGEGTPNNWLACTGKPPYGVCVLYYNSTKQNEDMPWWKDLEDAIKIEQARQEQKKLEDKKQKQEETEKKKKGKNQKQSQLPQETRANALKSTKTATEEAEQDNTQNISTPIATTEETSGTLITTPCSWLLSALLLI
ncbi:Variant surface glycoprotein [Trypanosoma congolense IL3000]|uniref:Variant surface glycoprotein n=1 Tax=Trypanosoma congolense (strain IL3000) TaxID=1068625 RepID=F9WHM5_TRYCI|nr:Variant surface glycoprotein [Trypanosoma congolense IL3000]